MPIAKATSRCVINYRLTIGSVVKDENESACRHLTQQNNGFHVCCMLNREFRLTVDNVTFDPVLS